MGMHERQTKGVWKEPLTGSEHTAAPSPSPPALQEFGCLSAHLACFQASWRSTLGSAMWVPPLPQSSVLWIAPPTLSPFNFLNGIFEVQKC